MKKFHQKPVPRALAVLTAGLVLGGALAASAQNTLPEPSVYYMKSNYVAGTVAPYSAGGGVPAQSILSPLIQTGTNCTLNWYGTMGWYSILGSPDMINWTTLGTVEAQNFGNSTTVTNPFGATAYFQLSQANSYSGQGNCGSCHGAKYTPWLGTEHATAYNTLVNIHQNNNPECIVCHTVGYGQPTGFTDPVNTPYLENVGCEDCHGPAGWHKSSDHSVILPVVSMDPTICGSCHQGSEHPTYQEYTNLNVAAEGILHTGYSHNNTSISSALSCSPCHSANNRMVMLNENLDMLAGNPHPVSLYASSSDAGAWTATCATCHDPHSSNQVAQLRYPTFSTNFFTMPDIGLSYTSLVTNYDNVITTNTVNLNTTFDSLYNPKVQVCAQCHNGRESRWDGTTYGFVTNTVAVSATNVVDTDVYTTNTWSQVFTNSSGLPYLTNNYVGVYVSGVTTSTVVVTNNNQVVGVAAFYPLIAYTNGGVVYYSTNASGFSTPHPNNQYRILIGQDDYDYASVAGVPNVLTDAHTLSPNQCADCHVPQYALNGANVTGHSFIADYNGCLASCHSSDTLAGLQADTANLKTTTSNSIARVVALLAQWGTNVSPAILRTNYGPLAWEFPKPGGLSSSYTKFKTGPPLAYSPSFGAFPSGTNDNVQLNWVPQDILIARYSLYTIYEDQSLGVHNPTYVNALLADAENRVANQFATSNYPAWFTATPQSGFAPLSVTFNNPSTGITSASWNFGDTGTASGVNPTHVYNTPGLYSVSCTANGASLSRSNFIWVQAAPLVSFVANNPTVTHPATVTFTNTSTSVSSVYLWTWSPMAGVSGVPAYNTAGGNFSFTYTNAGTYSVSLQAICPGGSSVATTNTAYITVQ